MNHLGTQTLITPRLTLRPFRREDAEAAFRNWCSDDEVTKFLRWPTHRSLSVTEGVIGDWVSQYAEPTFYQWAIVPVTVGEPVGTISVVEQNERAKLAHIGYCIGSRWWHQGITTEAFRAVMDFLFRQVGYNRIESQHDPDNPNSGRVMQNCGMTCEGTLRQADWSNRGIVDAVRYGNLREEYEGI